MAGGWTGDRIRGELNRHRAGSGSAPALFLRELSADGVFAPAERRFLLVQRVPGTAARFRKVLGALAEPGRRQAADFRRIRARYDSQKRGDADGSAALAPGSRGARRSGGDNLL